MSTVTVPSCAEREVDPTRRSLRHRAAAALGTITGLRAVALTVLALQLAAMLAWSAVLVGRFSLTYDFGTYYQGWWLIGHGHLDPYSTVNGVPYWTNNGEFYLWPLALFSLISPSPMMMTTLQCAGLVAAEWVAFGWMCDMARPTAGHAPGEAQAHADGRWRAVVCGVGLLLLVADPWNYWSVSFAYHSEPIGVLFVMLLARDLYRDPARPRIWLWALITLLFGDVMTTYLVAVGLCAAVAGRPWRRTGLILAAVGVAYLSILVAIGGSRGADLQNYGYLVAGGASVQVGLPQIVTGILRHPQRVVEVLWRRRLDLYADIAPAGLLGVLSPWVAVAAVLVLVENGINANQAFIAPSFQCLVLYVMVPVGTVQVLMVIGRRHRRLAAAIAALVAVNAIGWGAVWTSRTATQWLRVSPQAATVLASVQHRIGADDEVVASQGVVGPFADREWAYAITGSGSLPVHAPVVWVIVAPDQGIEETPVTVSDALISELAGPLHAHLVASAAGVWAFRWTPPRATRSLLVPARPPTVPAWTAIGPAGRPSKDGPVADWRADASGPSGYVVSGDYWREPPDTYRATVTLASTVPVNVEVWNLTADVLLARRSIPPTNGPRAVTLVVDARHLYGAHTYEGVGPFTMLPVSPPPRNALEIRVWTPGGGVVTVASLELIPVSEPSSN